MSIKKAQQILAVYQARQLTSINSIYVVNICKLKIITIHSWSSKKTYEFYFVNFLTGSRLMSKINSILRGIQFRWINSNNNNYYFTWKCDCLLSVNSIFYASQFKRRNHLETNSMFEYKLCLLTCCLFNLKNLMRCWFQCL